MPEESFTEEDGKIKFTPSDRAAREEDALGPFNKMTNSFIDTIESGMKEMSKDDNKTDTRDMILIVLGALSFTVGHYYSFLKKMGVVKDLDSFLSDLNQQVRNSVKLFEEGGQDGGKRKR